MKADASHPFRILLCGFYGCGNMGDDALLVALLREIKAQAPRVEVSFAIGKDGDTLCRIASQYGATAVPRKHPALIEAILRSDALIFGGGSIFQNESGQASLLYYLALLHFARLLGKKTAILAGGIGPLHGKHAERMTARALSHLDYASFRDGRAQNAATRLGVPSPRLSADLALLLRERECGIPLPPRFFLVALRKKGHTAGVAAKLLLSCGERLQMPPVFCLPFPSEDEDYTREVVGAFSHLCHASGKDALAPKLLPPLCGESLLSVTRRASLVLTARYHVAVFAYACGVPLKAVGDDPKLLAIAAETRPVEVLRRLVFADVAACVRELIQ